MRRAAPGPASSAAADGFGSATRLQQIVEVQRAVAVADLDLHTVMTIICERTQALTGADAAAVLLPEGRRFRYGAASGRIASTVGEVLTMRSLSGWAFLHNESAWSNDTFADERVHARAVRKSRMRSMIVVPLRHGGRAIGLLQVSSAGAHAFSEEDVQTLDLLSVVLSAAMSHASEFEALERFRTVFDGSPIGIARLDGQGTIADANPALAAMLGYDLGELSGLSFGDITDPADIDETRALFRDLLRGERASYTIEKRYRRKSGETIWCQGTATALERDATGRATLVIAMIENVNERKLAELALRESNERQARIAETQAEVAAVGLDVDAAMQLVVERSMELTTADGAAIGLLDGDEIVWVVTSGRATVPSGTRIPADASLSMDAIRTGRPVLANDPSDPRFFRPITDALGITAMACAPLRSAGKVAGVILAASLSAEKPLTDDDVRTLDLLSAVLSSALSRHAELEAERERVEAMRRFEAAWQMSQVGIEMISLDGRVIAANPAMDEVYGYTPEEYADMYVSDFTHPEDVSEVARRFYRLIKGECEGDRCTIEARFFHKSGEVVWVDGSMSLVRDVDGKPLHVLGMAQNVTERKHTELALRESEERQARIAETQAEIAAAALDLDAAMQLVADRSHVLTSADGAAILLREGDDLVCLVASGPAAVPPGAHVPLQGSVSADALASGRPVLVTDPDDPRLFRPVLDPLHVSSLVSVPLFRGGKAFGVLAAMGGDRERPLGEDDVRTLDLLAVVLSSAMSRAAELEALARFESIFREAPIGIGLVGPDGSFVDVNPAMCAIDGYDREEHRGEPIATHIHPDDAADVMARARQMAAEGKPYTGELRLVRKDGETVWIQSAVAPATDAGRFSILMSHDVTQRKLAEHALHENAERLREIVATQNELAGAQLNRESELQLIVERAQLLTGAELAAVNVIEGDRLVTAAAAGAAAEAPGHERPLAQTLTRHAIESGRAILVPHASRDKRLYRKLARRLGDGSHICVPLFRGSEPLGSLTVSSTETGKRLGDDDVQTLELLALALAGALSRASEVEALARFETIFRDAPIGVGIVDLEGRLVQANEPMRQISGYSTEELATMRITDYLHPDDRAASVDAFTTLVRGGFENDTCRVEARVLALDGRIVWTEAALSVVRDHEGRALFVVDMVNDITQQKKAELALQENAERLARVVETQNEAAVLGGDVDAVVELILRRTTELTRAAAAYAEFVDEDELVMRAAIGDVPAAPGERRAFDGSIVAAAAKAGTAILRDDDGCRICVPLYRGGELVGAVTARAAADAEPLDEQDLRTGELLGLVLSSSLARANELGALRRFETIYQGAPIGVGILGLDGRFIEVNQQLVDLAGRDADELRRLYVREYTHPDDEPLVMEKFRGMLAGECDSFNIDSRVIRPDGGIVWASTAVALVRDADGKPLFAIDMAQDRTQQKLAEQALEANRDRLATILETQTQIAAAALDLDGVMRLIVERSQALTRGTGAMVDIVDGDDLVTRAAVGSAAPTLGNRRPAIDSRDALETGHALLIEHAEDDPRLYRPLADALGVRSLVCVPLFKGGHAVGALTVVSDDPERRLGEEDRQTLELLAVVLSSAISRAAEFEAERQRVETLTRYETIYSGAPWGISVLGLDGRAIEQNDAARGLTGFSAEELRESYVSDYTHPDDVADSVGKFKRLVRGEIPAYRFEHRLVRRDGSTAWVDSSVSLLRDADGRPYAALSLAQDITKRKAAEEQLRQSQKIEAIGQLSAGIAHDFNNLLMGVLGYAGLARGEVPEGTRVGDYLDRIEKTAHRAATLTKQLLAFGRRQTLQPRVLDLNELVSETVAMLERVLGEHVEIVPRLDPSVPALRADPTQLQQVLFNLALNARDAMPDGGTLTMGTSTAEIGDDDARGLDLAPGRYVVLTVGDTGVGMAQEVLERIFEPFFTTKGVGEGTGLGLPSVYGIVKQSRGDIEVTSEQSRGTTFRIYLPPAQGTSRRPPGAQTDGPRARVLLVEEAQIVRDLVATLLGDNGYDVVVAAGPADAVRIAQEAPPVDVLLTDLVLSRTSGADLAARIQEHQPSVRVLYMSGYEPDQRVDHDVLIPKPFANEELLGKLEAVLAAARV